MDKNIIKKFVNMFISMMNIANPRRIIVHVASLFLLLKDRFLVPVITIIAAPIIIAHGQLSERHIKNGAHL